MKSFDQSREVSLARPSDTTAIKVTLSLVQAQLRNARRLTGPIFWEYGFARNDHAIDRFLAQHHAEGLSSRCLLPDDLFRFASFESFKI